MMNIIFIAPPAAGKGTQAKLVSNLYNIPHISTGDLLRYEVESKSELGLKLADIITNGDLVSDEVILSLLQKRLEMPDCNNGYILDGFPRNLSQAMMCDKLLDELGGGTVVIYFDISLDLARKRALSRIVCSHCGTSYNLEIPELTPKNTSVCDKCGSSLNTRSDDNDYTFNHRFDTYINNTSKVLDYYKEKGILREIKVDGKTVEDIFNEVKEILDNGKY